MLPKELEQQFRAGNRLGVTSWLSLSQDMLTEFEVLTRSNDPLHTDPEWVSEHTDFASTIAPGFLTLSLLPYFYQQLDITPRGYHALNYGLDRVRWVAPVPVGSEVRAVFDSAGAAQRRGGRPGLILNFDVTLEIHGVDTPAMMARWLGALVPDAAT